MKEGRAFLKIFLLLLTMALVILVSGTGFFDISLMFYDLYISSYYCEIDISKTNLTLSGTPFNDIFSLKIEEEYKFVVKDSKKMLFRFWKVPLFCAMNSEIEKSNFSYLGDEFVALLSLESDSGIPYVKDSGGRFYIVGDRGYLYQISSAISSIANNNEVGIISRDLYFDKGEYSFRSSYLVYFVYRNDGHNSHVNIKLADEHSPYKKVTIVIKDNEGVIEEVYPHLSTSFFSIPLVISRWLSEVFPNLTGSTFRKEGNTYLIEGISPKDKIIGIEILMKNVPILGIKKRDNNVAIITKVVNIFEDLLQLLRVIVDYLVVFLVIFLPIGAFIVYTKYGREKFAVVPKYLSFLPNRDRKPWMVNGVFMRESTDINAFVATLWDIERRGLVSIDEGGITIKSRKIEDLDEYELRVFNFITKYSSKEAEVKRFDFNGFKSLVDEYYRNSQISELQLIKEDFDSVVSYSASDLMREFVDRSGEMVLFKICKITVIGISVMFLMLYILSKVFLGYIYFADLFWKILGFVAMSIVLLLQPSHLFGRWKGELYKEKLEWEAFARFLSSFTKIKEMGFDRVGMDVWKEWFVYAVALGVGGKFVENLMNLGLEIPVVSSAYYSSLESLTDIYNTTSSHVSSLSSQSGGGGYGGSGGSGGGGAGGR
ncbi:MAG: DUF2207 domain-containing protein [Brevinematia bacterium]